MRELNECTAEVFRRSEQRIRERRRKRGRILALCIPVCLIAAVWPAVIFPSLAPEIESDYLLQTDGESAGSVPGSLACPYAAVEIRAAGMIEEVTDRLAVAELFDAVDSLFAAGGNGQQVNGNLPAGEEMNGNLDLSNIIDKSENHYKVTITFVFTFTAGDGSRAEYRLSENTLVNVSTNETIFLSEAQAAWLLAVFGLAE